MPPAPAVSELQEKEPVAGFLNKSYFFWSKRKGSKIMVDRLHKVCMLNVQVYVFYIYIYI